jgi:hypothetical protein
VHGNSTDVIKASLIAHDVKRPAIVLAFFIFVPDFSITGRLVMQENKKNIS